MIVALKAGGQLILSECAWVPGVYLAAGNMRGSQGVILRPDELDQAIAELSRIRAAIAERHQPKEERAA
jgi:hypothetical protein